MRPWQLAVALGLVVAMLLLALTLNQYYVFVLANVALLAIVGVGLNVLIGLSGLISFGHVGFYAIGAYAVAILTTRAGLGFWIAWPLAIAVSAAFGALLALPSLRVRGPYLAMVTIAFGFIVEHTAVEASALTGGQNGIMDIDGALLGALLRSERAVAVVAIVAAALCLLMYRFLARGDWGAAFRAVRDSETASESIGLDPLRVKTIAFTVSAALAGMAGGLYAPLSGFVTPGSFGFLQSILFVLVVVIGGSGTLLGPLVGAVIVGMLPELLARFEDARLLIFGALLLCVLWIAPHGVVGVIGSLFRTGVVPTPSRGEPEEHAGADLDPRPRKTLSAAGLGMRFGGVNAVSDLDLATAPARITSLIGPNGAGKSTVINMLSGFYTPTQGQMRLDDARLEGRNAWAIARMGVARTYQTSQLFGSLNVLDNVALALARGQLGALLDDHHVRSRKARSRAIRLLRWCGYDGSLVQPAGDLAHVDRRLVEIARALATDPDVLLLDEPGAGLSADDKARLGRLLRRIADAGIGVLLVEHDMALVMGISDHVVVIDAGTLLAQGSPAEVQADAGVRNAYLGDANALQAGIAAPDASRPAHPASAGGASSPLAVRDLVAGYGASPVLHGISLSVPAGRVLALLGANGAGKTTLMRSLAGLHRPVRGVIALGKDDIAAQPAERIARNGLRLVPEGRQVFPELSVQDNLRLGAFLSPQGSVDLQESMLERFPRLRERLHQRAGLLSGGEQQMLAIARALMGRPRILLLDEPSLGLAPRMIEELFGALRRLRDDGMTLLIVDQLAALALALADEASVLESGRIVAQGSAAQIAADPALAHAYLGTA